MSGLPAMNSGLPIAPAYVGYRDLTGGLNTRKDSHVLSRDQLQVSQNAWYPSAGVIGKRPGSTTLASGATGSAAACQAIVASRFVNISTLVTQTNTTALYFAKVTDANWTAISTALTAAANNIQSAQMFDPDGAASPGADILFIVDGKDTPQMWKGPGNTTIAPVATGAGKCPTNRTNAAAITPKYVAVGNYRLFYAGEPTEPSAVYISDPFFPERFTSSAVLTAGVVTGSYIPYLIARSDGVSGGDITGLAPLGNAMLVFKQSAIYRMDYGFSLFGDTVYTVTPVSVSVGCTSPRSIAKFDTHICFLGIDGVYITDGFSTTKISRNIPTFFDGPSVDITDRTTAVGARFGNRYLMFYDNNNVGYPQTGMWFDFNKLDEDQLPTAGQMFGTGPASVFLVNGACELRGPADTGLVAWCNGAADQTALFGSGSSDLTTANVATPINWNFEGKSDYFAEFFETGAPLKEKFVDDVTLELALPAANGANQLTFTCAMHSDLGGAGQVGPVAVTTQQFLSPPNAIVGTAVVGTAVIGATVNSSVYQLLDFDIPNPAVGRVLSFNFSENSIYPSSVLGYDVKVNPQQVTQS